MTSSAFGISLTGLLLSISVMGAARADDAPPGCDFFVAQQIGQLCGRAGFVGVSAQKQSNVETLLESFSGASYRVRYERAWDDAGAGFTIQPWNGWRFSYHSQTEGYGYERLVQGPNEDWVSKTRQWRTGWQSLLAEKTLIDRTIGGTQVVFDAVERFDFVNVPNGNGGNAHRDFARSSLQLGVRQPLAGTPYSVNFLTDAGLDDYTNPDLSEAFASAQALLSYDALGVAVGPVADSSWTLAHSSNSFVRGYPLADAGAGALLQPFRGWRMPLLSDTTLALGAMRSLGQLHLDSTRPGSFASWDYTASLRVNFRF